MRIVGRITASPAFLLSATAAYVISAYASTYVPLAWLWRPLFISLGAVAVIYVALWLVLRRRWWASVGVGVLLLLTVRAEIAALILVLVSAGWALAQRQRGNVTWSHHDSVFGFLNLAAVAWLAMTVVAAASITRPATLADPLVVPGPDARPDIHLLLLDAYARGDTLASFGFDNEPFLRELEGMGFEVDREAEGNYTGTVQTVAAMLQMRHVDEIAEATAAAEVDQYRQLRRWQDEAPAFATLRAIGYEIWYSDPGSEETALQSVDVRLGGDGLNEFETHLLSRTRLGRAIELFAPEFHLRFRADRVVTQFEQLAELSPSGVPRLIYTHVMAPHTPFMFRADGSPASLPECYPSTCGSVGGGIRELLMDRQAWGAAYAEQVAHVNTLVLARVSEIVADDPEAVVIVFSDHGSRYDPQGDSAERYRILWASRTPGLPGLFEGQEQPASLFVGLLRGYFGADIAWPSASVRFVGTGEGPLKLMRQVTP